jgi:hypothetical protein
MVALSKVTANGIMTDEMLSLCLVHTNLLYSLRILCEFYGRFILAFSTGCGGRLHRSLQVLARPLRASLTSLPPAAQSCTLPKSLTALAAGSLVVWLPDVRPEQSYRSLD